MNSRQCIFCRTRFILLRNPNQRYCSKSFCQKKRQNHYKRQKLKRDADYKQNQYKAQQSWCKNHPDYWMHYRSCKPEYAESYRIAQRTRNKNRHKKKQNAPLDVIAKRERYSQENKAGVLSGD